MKLFTTIRPPASLDELGYLRQCLASWWAAGFEPISINGPKESEALSKFALGIEVSVIRTDGKPRINAMLDVIRQSGERFAGLINSDCRIVGFPKLASSIEAGLEHIIRVAWRLDIGNGKPSACPGFDAYFFDVEILPTDDLGYSIGGSWWDYWFPLACEVAGATIETFRVPILTHKTHPLNYSLNDEIEGCMRLWRALKIWYAEGRQIEAWSFGEILDRYRSAQMLTPVQVGELSALVRPWIRRNEVKGIPLLPKEMGEIETMLRLGGDAMLAQMELSILEAQLSAIKNSMSWRITAPLRHLTTAVRKFTR